ncbi:hypothetical protein V6N13_125886 [Hibiscus sabdariffa]|uniref:Uncharacterized protein n=2 Tax=Hibiscus sabdariffa TaxID=183260 RepID=A0ABR2AK78_9ROSI
MKVNVYSESDLPHHLHNVLYDYASCTWRCPCLELTNITRLSEAQRGGSIEKDDVHLLDVDDVETIITDATEENSLDVEDDVWSAVVAMLGLGNDKHAWGYVGLETEQPVLNYPAYEPPARIMM